MLAQQNTGEVKELLSKMYKEVHAFMDPTSDKERGFLWTKENHEKVKSEASSFAKSLATLKRSDSVKE